MQQQEYGLKADAQTRSQSVQIALERELDAGEELLWSAQPSPQSHNRPAPARVFLILGTVFASVGLGLVILGSIFSGLNIVEAAAPLFGIGGTFLLLGIIYIIVAIFLKIPLKNTIYAITPQRIIVIQTGQNTTVDSYSKKDIGQITSVERPDGTGDIFFQGNGGSYYGNNSYQRYNGAYNTSGSWGSLMNKGKLLGIVGVKDVERLIRRTFLNDNQPPSGTPYAGERGYTGPEF